jgi:hydroxymethylpyrimidine/phosphomethylpyrimidine kinase
VTVPILDEPVADTLVAMTPPTTRPPCVLSIAGSDSGGGAGVQADLKAFARCGVHGMTAITAITAQSTVGVSAVEAISPEVIVAQVEAVAADIGVDAVKVGMLGSVETVEAVERALGLVPEVPVVLDPVMVAESGAALSDEATRAALVERLLARATVVTPNVSEARMLAASVAGGSDATGGGAAALDDRAATFDELARLAEAVHSLGAGCVVVTGGHALEAADGFFDGERLERIDGTRQSNEATHGSGCTHSSALAAQLARRLPPLEAARRAKAIAEEAVANGLRAVGAGAGPVDALGALGASHAAEADSGAVGALP